jgi:hypothetical protein
VIGIISSLTKANFDYIRECAARLPKPRRREPGLGLQTIPDFHYLSARALARIGGDTWSRGMNFEDAGRAVDRELAKLREFLAKEVQPQTRQEMADFLRGAADRLAKLAERLEKAKP